MFIIGELQCFVSYLKILVTARCDDTSFYYNMSVVDEQMVTLTRAGETRVTGERERERERKKD